MNADRLIILFVDDEHNILHAIRRHLIHAPYATLFAQSGKAALSLLAEQPVDIVVADLRMPEMDGITLLQRVREHYPDILRLVLSASVDRDLILDAINSGEVYRFIPKPIADMRHLIDMLDQAADQVRLRRQGDEAERLKAAFMASITHELKSPLASIKGFTETILRDASMDEATRVEFLDTVVSECERLMQLITSVLEISRIEAGGYTLTFAPTDPGLLIEETVESMRREFSAAGIALKMVVPATVPELAADRERLIQVFRNILDNALKYTPPGGEVCVSLAVNRSAIEIRIADSGCGIAPADLPRVCERFFRGSQAASRIGGAGLGLAVVKEILDRHGWELAIDSPDGNGTIVTITAHREAGESERMEEENENAD